MLGSRLCGVPTLLFLCFPLFCGPGWYFFMVSVLVLWITRPGDELYLPQPILKGEVHLEALCFCLLR